MAEVSVDDNGLMAAVFAPIDEIKRTIDEIDGYVVVANLNSSTQAVIGGATPAVQAAVAAFAAAGHQAIALPVSHAFHTSIVAPAAEPLKQVLTRLDLEPPHIPIIANVTGEFYPMGPAVVPDMIEILGRQVASPVQFIRGLESLYEAGIRVFVEVGPKRALHGFVQDVLDDHGDVVNLFTNHPKGGDVVAFNQALCGLYAAGHGVGTSAAGAPDASAPPAVANPPSFDRAVASPAVSTVAPGDRIHELGELFVEFLDRGYQIYSGGLPATGGGTGSEADEPVVITGAALGLPGTEYVFDDANIERLLDGESFIDVIPVDVRDAIVDKHITRLVKSESGGGSFEEIDSAHDVIKLAGRKGRLDIVEQFAIVPDRQAALDPATELAFGAGIDALRDAGLPLVMRYKTTSTGSQLPDGWALPPALRDDTGIIFASAFPGYDRLVDEVTRYEHDRARRTRLQALEHLRERMTDENPVVAEIDHMIHEQRADIEDRRYEFDRRFLFKVLSMGHSQFAEHIGARGPNTQINSACASTTQAVALAEDWIRLGRCERVVIIAGDDVTTDSLLEWIGAGFLSTGAAATDEVVEEAALPFDKRRHGMLLGMGGAAVVVESAHIARERGIRPICQVLSTVTANSAFHGSRLDVDHIRHVMEKLVAGAERKWGIDRHEMASGRLVFVSHETYTPARGGSASGRGGSRCGAFVFGAEHPIDHIVVANTKGFTGHAMGAGHRGRRRGEDPRDRRGPADRQRHRRSTPTWVHAQSVEGRRLPRSRYALRLGCRLRVAGQHVAACGGYPTAGSGPRREPDELGYRIPGRLIRRPGHSLATPRSSGYDTPETSKSSNAASADPRRTAPPSDASGGSGASHGRPGPSGQRTAPASVPAGAEGSVSAPATAEDVAGEQVAAAAPSALPPEAAATGIEATVVGVEGAVLGVVAAQTGYPAEMLDLESGSGGGSGDRHGEAGGDVRGGA